MRYDWLLLNPLGNQGSQRRSKNNLRGITIGIGHKEDKLSGPSSFLGAGYSKQQKPMNGAKNIYKNPRKHAPVLVNRARISSLGRALDCRAGGRGFDSREGPILQVIKWLRNEGTARLCPANGYTCNWLGWPCKVAPPSPVGDLKNIVHN